MTTATPARALVDAESTVKVAPAIVMVVSVGAYARKPLNGNWVVGSRLGLLSSKNEWIVNAVVPLKNEGLEALARLSASVPLKVPVYTSSYGAACVPRATAPSVATASGRTSCRTRRTQRTSH